MTCNNFIGRIGVKIEDYCILVALAETMWPEEFLLTPDRKEEEEKLVEVRKIPLVWGEEGGLEEEEGEDGPE